jgi:DNA-binding NarL/FixJ family response regulator
MKNDPTQKIKILIAEDHELTRNGLIFSFNKMSDFIVVGEAANGAKAIRLAEEKQPDIILMDLAMPVMDGVEATQRIKKMFPEMKVIFLTSHQDEQEVHASLAAGAHAYCLKDIELERLIQVIEMVQEGSIWIDPAIGRLVMHTFMSNPQVKKSNSGASRQKYRLDLTEREKDVLRLMVDGKSNRDIAAELSITIHTAKAHVGNIMQKLAVDDRTQAAIKALREGLLQDDIL